MTATNLQRKSNHKFYSEISEDKQKDLGSKLWKQLKELEQIYDQKPMSKFYGENKFSDMSWKVSEIKNINWNKILEESESNYPLILLLKITAYHYIQVLGKVGEIFVGNLNQFNSIFGKRFAEMGILAAPKNQLFTPASIISEDLIKEWVTDAADNNEIKAPMSLDILEKMESIPLSRFHGLKQLKMECSFPWKDHNGEGGITKRQNYLNELLGAKATRTEIKHYQPFSEAVCAQILDFSIPIVTDYAKDLEAVFKLADDLNNFIPANKKVFSAKGRDKVLEYSNTLNKILPYKLQGGYQLNISYINDLYDTVQAASIWIILLTSAIRNVDLRKNLFKQCYIKDKDSDLIYYLVTDIQKTKLEDFVIPIPALTVQAIDFLNNINQAPSDCSNLIVRRVLERSSKKAKTYYYSNGQQIGALLRKMAALINVDLLDELEECDNDEGVAHRCRATMAGWIGTNSPLAVLLVRRLFGHTNGVMPDHYLRNNTLVKAERRKIQQQTYIQTADEYAEAIVNGTFSGGSKKSIEASKEILKQKIIKDAESKNLSLTQGEIRKQLKQRIAEIFYRKLFQGEVIGLMTSLSFVCFRNPASVLDAPCSIDSSKQKRINQKINQAFAKSLQMTGLPELENCKGPSCMHSFLYDNPLAKLLLKQFKYYISYLEGVTQSDVDLDMQSQNFIELYYGPLLEVYPDEMSQYSNSEEV